MLRFYLLVQVTVAKLKISNNFKKMTFKLSGEELNPGSYEKSYYSY